MYYGGFWNRCQPVSCMVYHKITKNEKKVLTNREFDATIGPSPAGVNPIHTPVPRFPPNGSQSYMNGPPCWFAQRGFFLWGPLSPPMVRKLTIPITLKVEKICRVCIANAGGVGCPSRTRARAIFLSCLSTSPKPYSPPPVTKPREHIRNPANIRARPRPCS